MRGMTGFRKMTVFLLLITAGPLYAAFSQDDSLKRDYIARYARWAVNEMYYSGIPASITMAQALLESQYGTSELALNANNHFGIKCQREWSGRTYTYQDDDDNTCFRLYDSVFDSYRDHSHFLMYRPRYSFLFEMDPKDYAAWAHGLKKAGYATNPHYAQLLIKLVVDFNLDRLDSMKPDIQLIAANTGPALPNPVPVKESPVPRVFHRNRIEFVYAREGDNIEKLTKDLDKLRWEIRKYNEIPKNQDVKPGDVVYLQPKRRKAEPGYSSHTAEPGETMYNISQHYGIRLSSLYKINRMSPGSEPRPGEVIWLRGKKRLTPQ